VIDERTSYVRAEVWERQERSRPHGYGRGATHRSLVFQEEGGASVKERRVFAGVDAVLAPRPHARTKGEQGSSATAEDVTEGFRGGGLYGNYGRGKHATNAVHWVEREENAGMAHLDQHVIWLLDLRHRHAFCLYVQRTAEERRTHQSAVSRCRSWLSQRWRSRKVRTRENWWATAGSSIVPSNSCSPPAWVTSSCSTPPRCRAALIRTDCA